jgi:hypothetical protein
MGKKIMTPIREEQPGSYFRELGNNFLGFKYSNLMRIQDPGWKKFGSGINIRIRNNGIYVILIGHSVTNLKILTKTEISKGNNLHRYFRCFITFEDLVTHIVFSSASQYQYVPYSISAPTGQFL